MNECWKISMYLLVMFNLYACSSKDKDKSITEAEEDTALVYLSITKDNNDIDTLFRKVLSSNLEDSIYTISYSTTQTNIEGSFEENYIIPIRKKALVDEGTYPTVTTLQGLKKINYQGEVYIIYKCFYDELNASDEEMLFFFEPTYGIIIDKNAWWRNYNRLIGTGKANDKEIVFYLGEMILADSVFFNTYNIPARE